MPSRPVTSDLSRGVDSGHPGSAFLELDRETVVPYLVDRGLLTHDKGASVDALEGGVSATVFAVRSPTVAVVVKQALERLKVPDDWRAKRERTEVEAAAIRLCETLTPGRVPRLIDTDSSAHIIVMELLPDDARNWQSEIAEGRSHVEMGSWAGATLGTWHARTDRDPRVAAEFDDFESFEQLRLRPFHETLIQRLPEVEGNIVPLIEELRQRRCFVDGDFAMKNILVAPDRAWVLDLEVAHYGNPVFDLGFFLSFAVLSAIQWPASLGDMRELACGFMHGYANAAGEGFAGTVEAVNLHTAALILARTDGMSPAQFLDPGSRMKAREAGIMLLRQPERGLWQWL